MARPVAWRDHKGLQAIFIVVIFGVALALRLWGIDAGMPRGQLPDETNDIATSLQIVKGEVPEYTYHRVAWPMFQIPLHGAHFLVKKLADFGYSLDRFEAEYFTRRQDFIMSARIYSAVWASLACVVVYGAGLLATKHPGGGLLSGGLLALHPAHVYLSHVALPDAFATLWVGLNLLGTLLILNSGSRWGYVLAGAAAAVAMLVRLQTAALVILPVVAAHGIAWWRFSGRSRQFLMMRWLWAAGAFVAASVVFNPFIVLAPGRVWDDVQFIFDERYTGTNNWQPELQQFDPLSNIRANREQPVNFLRPYVLVLALLAAAVCVLRRETAGLAVVFAFGVIAFTLLPTTIPRITFWLPAVVVASLLVAIGLFWAMSQRQAIIRVAGIGLLAGVVALSGFESVTIDRVLARPTTQTLAYEYITHHVPPGAAVMQGNEFTYSVPLARNMASITRLAAHETLPPVYEYLSDHPDQITHPAYDIFGPEAIGQIRSDDDMLAFLDRFHIDYVVETDYCAGPIPYDQVASRSFPLVTAGVRDHLTLLYTASPFESDVCLQVIPDRTPLESMSLGDWQRTGPIIRVYRVKR